MNGVVKIEGFMGNGEERWEHGRKGVVEERREIASE